MKEIVTKRSDGSKEITRVYSDEEVANRPREDFRKFIFYLICGILGFIITVIIMAIQMNK